MLVFMKPQKIDPDDFREARAKLNVMVINTIIGSELVISNTGYSMKGWKPLPSNEELEQIESLVESFVDNVEARFIHQSMVEDRCDLVRPVYGNPESIDITNINRSTFIMHLIESLTRCLSASDFMVIAHMASQLRSNTVSKITRSAVGAVLAVVGGVLLVRYGRPVIGRFAAHVKDIRNTIATHIVSLPK